MKLEDITPVILTYNEVPNIGRCLERLRWAERVLVVDSGSTDETVSITREFPNVEILERPFDSFAGQCNCALAQVATEWALSLDADYILPEGFQDVIARLPEGADGYRFGFRYCISGRPLRGTLYPARTILYRRLAAKYEDHGHGHKVRIDGAVTDAHATIDHDDRKPLSRWLASQTKYASQEVDHLLGLDRSRLSFADKVRLMIWPAAPAAFVYTLLVKGLLFDGWPGLYYSLQRTYAELLLSLMLLERKLAAKPGGRAEALRDRRQPKLKAER